MRKIFNTSQGLEEETQRSRDSARTVFKPARDPKTRSHHLPSFATLSLLLLCFGIRPALRGSPPASAATFAARTFALVELRRDFDQLCETIVGRHPLYHADLSEFKDVVSKQRSQLREGMSEAEFFRLLSPIVRATNCGHARLSPSKTSADWLDQSADFLPLKIAVIDDRLFVLASLPGVDLPGGAEIRRIDGRTTTEILAILFDGIPADGSNHTRKIHFLNERFHEWYYLLVSSATNLVMTCVDPLTGRETDFELVGVAKAKRAFLDQAAAIGSEIGETEFNDTHARLQVKSFHFYDDAGRQRFNAFVDNFFSQLAVRNLPTLILDLRGNGGGDPYCGAYLLSHLLPRPVPYFAESGDYYADLKQLVQPANSAFTGRLLVLIDGGVFSTTGQVCSLLKHHGIGWFIGDETGGSFACTSNSTETVLSHTGLRLGNATTVFRTAVSGLPFGRGIMPDTRITPEIQHRLSGDDPAMKAALKKIRGSKH